VSVLLGRGDGTFQAPLTLPVGSGPFSLAAGDFNHDGHLDLVAANSGSHDVSILLGRGDGTFQNQVRYAIGPNVVSPVVGDFNGDGCLDLAIANTDSMVAPTKSWPRQSEKWVQ
jgi:FG-GAP-like repeat